MPKMIIIECSDEEADRMVEQLKNMIAEYEYHPYHGPGKVYEFGSLRIDQPKQEVTLNGVMVDLTRREFEILGLLAEHPNQALPADFLHNAVWSHPDADHGEEEVAAYRKGEDGEPEIVPEEAEHIKMIFNLFLLGRSLRQIKEALERRNVLTPRGNTEWSLSSIEHILRNEKYMGDVLLQKTYTVDFLTKKKKKNNGELTQYYITDNHPAIIPREDFLNAQLELARRNSKKKVSQKKTKSALGKYCSKYALSERLVCGECGSMYRRTTWVKKGKKKVVWRCISRLEFGTKYCQHSPTISEEALHQAILQCIQKVVGDKEDILKNLRDVQENIILFSGNQITPQSLEKQIDKLQQEMSALVKIIAQGGDSDFYAAKLRQLSEQKMDLTNQLQEIQKKKMADQAQEYQYQQALLYINNEENLNLTEFNDDFIRRIIEQVTVLSATQIRIRFVGGYEQDANLPLKK